MPIASSSLQTRISRSSGSREIGCSRPSLLTMSGTDITKRTPADLTAAMIAGPGSEPLTASAQPVAITAQPLHRLLECRNGRGVAEAEIGRHAEGRPRHHDDAGVLDG